MRTYLFNILAGFFFILSLGTIAFWGRSYYVRDIVSFGRAGGNPHTAQSILGRLHVMSWLSGGRVSGETTHTLDRLSPDAAWHGGMSGYPARVKWRLGFVFQHYPYTSFSLMGSFPSPPIQHRLIVIPYWALTLLWVLAALGCMAAGSRRRGDADFGGQSHEEPAERSDSKLF